MTIDIESLTVSDLSRLLVVASDKETSEFNELFDQLEEANSKIEEQNIRIAQDHKLLQKQELVIQTAVQVKQKDTANFNVLRAQYKELEILDAKGLAKRNAGYKKTITELKAKLENSEKSRKAANKHVQEVRKGAKTEGNAAFHFDPKTNNALRIIPGLYVGKDNEFGGIPGSPVIEFLHHARGITRQGMLLSDGTLGWADTKNSEPSEEESLVGREFLTSWCKSNKVKIK